MKICLIILFLSLSTAVFAQQAGFEQELDSLINNTAGTRYRDRVWISARKWRKEG